MDSKLFVIAIAGGLAIAGAACNQRVGVFNSPVETPFSPTSAPSAPRPPNVVSVIVSPGAINSGGSVRGTALLSGPAPAEGVIVSLSAGDDSATVSPTVSIPAGSNSAEFTVSTRVVQTDRSVVITASTAERSVAATLRVWAEAPVFFSYFSEPGDFIGSGGFDRLTQAGTTFTATCDRNYLTVTMRTANNDIWTANFSGPAGVPLRQGAYEGATRWPFNTATPGLNISGRGRGCNTLGGRFVIHDIDLQNNRVNRFHASFVQRCDNAAGLLNGDIRVVNMPATSGASCQR
ncbi:MAG TPA: hypothetical protein VM096_19215 [Vicinamibacterales bacterium]|nr:hypothetical protein [Vicinamibacterales bacterium]